MLALGSHPTAAAGPGSLAPRCLWCRRLEVPPAFEDLATQRRCKHCELVWEGRSVSGEVLSRCDWLRCCLALNFCKGKKGRERFSKAQGSVEMLFYEFFSSFFSLSFENLWQVSAPVFHLNIFVFLKSATWKYIFFFFYLCLMGKYFLLLLFPFDSCLFSFIRCQALH